MRNCLSGLGLVVALSATASPAYAYLDPGTGSIILQGLIAGLAAGGTIISLNYHRLKTKIRVIFGKAEDSKSTK
jgi:hypothetical protein